MIRESAESVFMFRVSQSARMIEGFFVTIEPLELYTFK